MLHVMLRIVTICDAAYVSNTWLIVIFVPVIEPAAVTAFAASPFALDSVKVMWMNPTIGLWDSVRVECEFCGSHTYTDLSTVEHVFPSLIPGEVYDFTAESIHAGLSSTPVADQIVLREYFEDYQQLFST